MAAHDSDPYTPHALHLHEDGTGTAVLGGEETFVDEGSPEATRKHLLSLAVNYARASGGRTLVRVLDSDGDVLIEADPGGTTQVVESGGKTRGGGAVRLPRPSGLRWSWAPLVAAIGASLLVVAALAFAVLTLVGGRGESGNAAQPESVVVEQGGALPQSPPLEWRQEALWASPPLMAEAQKVAVVDGELVGMVTADRRVALVDDAGQTRWTVELPEGDVHSPLSLTYADDTRVLAIHVGSRLVWWSVDDATAGGVDLPTESAPITWRGDTPLVGIGTDRVGIIQDAQLVELPVPAGARAVSAWADGHVIAASAAGWWRLTPGTEPGEVTPWDTPEAEPAEATVIDAMGPYVVTVQIAGDDQVLAVVHMDTGERVARLMADVLPGVSPGEALTWRPSSSRSWGILGHAIVDMENSSVTDLGSPWSTEHVIADRAMGTLGDERVIVSPDAPRGVMQQGESFAEEVLGTNALVRGRDENGAERVWLLPPNPDVPTAQLTTPATGG